MLDPVARPASEHSAPWGGPVGAAGVEKCHDRQAVFWPEEGRVAVTNAYRSEAMTDDLPPLLAQLEAVVAAAPPDPAGVGERGGPSPAARVARPSGAVPGPAGGGGDR